MLEDRPDGTVVFSTHDYDEAAYREARQHSLVVRSVSGELVFRFLRDLPSHHGSFPNPPARASPSPNSLSSLALRRALAPTSVVAFR